MLLSRPYWPYSYTEDALRSVIVFALALFGFQQLEASPAADCSRVLTHYDNMQVGRNLWTDTNICYVSIHPMTVNNMVYRDYLITSEGLFMVFNSFGPGENSNSTGAREFYFFPRGPGKLDVSYDSNNKELTVKISDEMYFIFDTQTAQIKSVAKGQVEVAPIVSPKNSGGVEFKNFGGLLMDVGFTVGRSPSERAQAKSIFKDHRGQTCSVINKEVFNYNNGEVDFKWNDNQLKDFLKLTCPQLQVSF